jgi:hypothetical protein
MESNSDPVMGVRADIICDHMADLALIDNLVVI